MKELQSLALDVRVLNDKGEEVQLSTLCNDVEPSAYANRAQEAAMDEEYRSEDEEFRKSFMIENEDGTDEFDDVDDEDSFEDDMSDDEEVFGDDDFADDYDNENN